MSNLWKVCVVDNLAVEGMESLRETGLFQIHQADKDIERVKEIAPHVIIVRSLKLPPELLENRKLTCIARAGAGVDNIPVEEASKKGIPVFNAPGANSNAVKEAVIGSMIALSRNLVPASVALRQEDKVDRSQFVGRELKGRTLGIVGLGQIGSRVAEAALSLGMKVICFDKYLSVKMALRLPPEVAVKENLDDLYKQADIITLHVALTPETKNMINNEAIGKMKPGAFVVNFARGDIVNAADMRSAIDDGRIAGYATDFPSDEYEGCDRVLMTPHIGASTKEAQINCAEMVSDSVMEYVIDGDVQNSVNFPTVQLERIPGAGRLIFANDNVPGMIGKVSSMLAERSINILGMANNSSEDIGYSIVDIVGTPPKDIIKAIRAVPGVLRVRGIDVEEDDDE